MEETPGEIGDILQRQESARGQVHLSSGPKSYEKVPDLTAICSNYPFPSDLRLKSNYTQHERMPGGHLISQTPLWSLYRVLGGGLQMSTKRVTRILYQAGETSF